MPESETTTDAELAVTNYIAAWNERDPERRRQLVTKIWTDEGSYLDPHASAEGHARIDSMIGEAQGRFANHRIELAAGPDAHNHRVRFIWHLLSPAGGEPVAIGMDFATLASDGRMREVTGFRGQLG